MISPEIVIIGIFLVVCLFGLMFFLAYDFGYEKGFQEAKVKERRKTIRRFE